LGISYIFVWQVEILEGEVQQLLDPGSTRTHRHTDSSGSIGSSRSASTREDGYSGTSHRSNMSHRARNQLLERDVAKLFTERVEIFTKLEFNQVNITVPGSGNVKTSIECFVTGITSLLYSGCCRATICTSLRRRKSVV